MAIKRKTRNVKRAAPKRTSHRSHRSSSSHVMLLPFSFQRIVLVTTAIALFLGVFVLFNKDKVTQSVAGISIARGLFAQARVELPKIENTVSYNIYYRKQSAGDYTNVARNIPATSTSYTISYLKKGEAYYYKIAAVDASGAEFSWTSDEVLTNIEPME